MSTYRTGNHWGVTIVREGERPVELDDCAFCCVSNSGCPIHAAVEDHLVAVVVNGDTALAERICALLNGEAPALVCICNDPPPTVHGKNMPATRPPGWACPRHGMVL
jgi:hypothetical protein